MQNVYRFPIPSPASPQHPVYFNFESLPRRAPPSRSRAPNEQRGLPDTVKYFVEARYDPR